jgi:hypothetical protein
MPQYYLVKVMRLIFSQLFCNFLIVGSDVYLQLMKGAMKCLSYYESSALWALAKIQLSYSDSSGCGLDSSGPGWDPVAW